MISQMSLAQKEKQALDRSLYYSKHPDAMIALEKQFEKPLDQGLIKGTENVVNASMAEQGLSQAPGIQSQVLSQALAPYKQNTQQMAITEMLKAIGLPAEALQSIQSIKDPSQLAMLLKSILPQQSPTATAPIPTMPNDPNSYPSLAPPWGDPTQGPPGGGAGNSGGIFG